ncbi:MAG TPA: hypothetical protein VHN78_15915, partial [Chloroflexota bacterium]|nr:hypothetical protein [Chloroflexota bacterium]
YFLDLGQQLCAFRAEHDLTQDEVARVVGASDRSVVSAVLEHLRTVDSLDGLRQQYCEDDGCWVQTVAAQLLPHVGELGDLRRAEDVAYSLRWLEIRHGLRLDLGHSLVRQVPLALLDQLRGDTMNSSD